MSVHFAKPGQSTGNAGTKNTSTSKSCKNMALTGAAATAIVTIQTRRPPRPPLQPPLPPAPPPAPAPPPPPPPPSSPTSRSNVSSVSSRKSQSSGIGSDRPLSVIHPARDHAQTGGKLMVVAPGDLNRDRSGTKKSSGHVRVNGGYGCATWGRFNADVPISELVPRNTSQYGVILNVLAARVETGCEHIQSCHLQKQYANNTPYTSHNPWTCDRSRAHPPADNIPVKTHPPPTNLNSRPPSPAGTLVSQAPSHASARTLHHTTHMPRPRDCPTHVSTPTSHVTCHSQKLMKCVECGSVQKPDHDNVKRLPAFGNLPMCWRCAFSQVGNEVGRIWLGSHR